MISAAILLALITATADDGACANSQQTVSLVQVKFAGEGCVTRPKQPFVRWWDKNGAPGEGFNITPGEEVDPEEMSAYDPPVVWITAEGASACVTGKRNDPPGAPPCRGVFRVPCATRSYELTISGLVSGLHASVRRLLRREKNPLRCEGTDDFAPLVRFSNGETLIITILSASNELICQRTVDLADLNGVTFRDTYDTSVREWRGKKRAKTRGDTSRNQTESTAKDAGLPPTISIEIRAVTE